MRFHISPISRLLIWMYLALIGWFIISLSIEYTDYTHTHPRGVSQKLGIKAPPARIPPNITEVTGDNVTFDSIVAVLEQLTNIPFYKTLNATMIRTAARAELLLDYPEFNTTEPNFISDEDRRLFRLCRDSNKHIGLHKESGRIAVIARGVVMGRGAEFAQDCGTNGDLDAFHQKKNVTQKSTKISGGVVIPLLIPDGGFFQHFLDGVMPKIAQIYDLLRILEPKVLLFNSNSRTVSDMLVQLGVTPAMAVYESRGILTMDIQLNTCLAPPIHPLLWRRGRDLLGVPTSLHTPGYVILILRLKTHNGGRSMKNRDAVAELMSRRYPGTFRTFTGDLTFAESVALFSRAAVVVGCHGGGMYNVHFSPPGVHVVELMPLTSTGLPPAGLATTIIWRTASALGHTYWRLHATSLDPGHNVNMPLGDLEKTLNNIDNIM